MTVAPTRRVAKLEWRAGPPKATSRCRDCGWKHAPERVTLELVRSIIGPLSIPAPEGWPPRRTEPFCACACCGEPGRTLAELLQGR